MTNICPHCKNPYLRHKGKKIKKTVGSRFKKEYTIDVYWTEEGYYCKRCNTNFTEKEVKEFDKQKKKFKNQP